MEGRRTERQSDYKSNLLSDYKSNLLSDYKSNLLGSKQFMAG